MVIFRERLSTVRMYSWQLESNVNVPGSSGRVARQFLKVVLQQLAPNGVFIHMFRTPIHGKRISWFGTGREILVTIIALSVLLFQTATELISSKAWSKH